MDVVKQLSNLDKSDVTTEATIKYQDENALSIFAGSDFYKLLEMFAWMERCCEVGHSSGFNVSVDGDGNAQFVLNFKKQELKKKYEEIKKIVAEKYKDNDPKGFYFGD